MLMLLLPQLPKVTIADVYEAAKYWLPLITIILLIVKAYHSAKIGVSDWADKLLNNHLSHIQTATESTASSMKELVGYQKASAASVEKVAVDLEQHQKDDLDIQNKILTGIEILKVTVKS